MKKILHFIVVYILSLFICFIFALYVSSRVGWFAVASVLIFPIFSFFYTFIANKFISVDYYTDATLCEKNKSLEFYVVIKNSFILPSPLIAIATNASPSLQAQNDTFMVSVMPRYSKKICIDYKAYVSGLSEIEIKKAVTGGFLGLASFRIKKISDKKINIGIVPEEVAIQDNDSTFRRIIQFSSEYNDDAESSETTSNSFTGIAGYEHREYIPGDQIKRINWKLSAKKDKLFVRLDEMPGTSKITVILDNYFESSKEITPLQDMKARENLTERSLGFVSSLLMHDYKIDYCYYYDNAWQRESIFDDKDFALLKNHLAFHVFSNDKGNSYENSDIIDSNSVCIIFSCKNGSFIENITSPSGTHSDRVQVGE